MINLQNIHAAHTAKYQKNKQPNPKMGRRDFPGGPVVKYLSSNAGDVGLIPGWETKIPHATGQISPCARTSEPMC